MAIPASPMERSQKNLSVWLGWLQPASWWGQCILLWLTVLVILTAVGLITARMVDLREGVPPDIKVSPDSIPGIWVRWDSGYYVHLASRGYASSPDAMGFFPLYPLLMAGLSHITGLDLYISGMLIAQLSYLAAILLLYKLARLTRDSHAYAMRCVTLMVLFPSSFFFFAVYAEPLYLALSILGVYLALRTSPRYEQAGLALGLASAARPVGWLSDIVLVGEFIKRRKFTWPSFLSLGIGLALSVCGIVLFVVYLYSITGTFWAIPRAQALWMRHWQYPWITYWKSISIAVTGNRVPGDWFLYTINWVDLFFTTLALILTALAIWRSFRNGFNWSLSLYLVGSLIFVLSTEGPSQTGSMGVDVVPLWGMTRWVAALFPLFLVLGDLGENKNVHKIIIFISAGLLLLFSAWWISGRWVG